MDYAIIDSDENASQVIDLSDNDGGDDSEDCIEVTQEADSLIPPDEPTVVVHSRRSRATRTKDNRVNVLLDTRRVNTGSTFLIPKLKPSKKNRRGVGGEQMNGDLVETDVCKYVERKAASTSKIETNRQLAYILGKYLDNDVHLTERIQSLVEQQTEYMKNNPPRTFPVQHVEAESPGVLLEISSDDIHPLDIPSIAVHPSSPLPNCEPQPDDPNQSLHNHSLTPSPVTIIITPSTTPPPTSSPVPTTPSVTSLPSSSALSTSTSITSSNLLSIPSVKSPRRLSKRDLLTRTMIKEGLKFIQEQRLEISLQPDNNSDAAIVVPPSQDTPITTSPRTPTPISTAPRIPSPSEPTTSPTPLTPLTPTATPITSPIPSPSSDIDKVHRKQSNSNLRDQNSKNRQNKSDILGPWFSYTLATSSFGRDTESPTTTLSTSNNASDSMPTPNSVVTSTTIATPTNNRGLGFDPCGPRERFDYQLAPKLISEIYDHLRSREAVLRGVDFEAEIDEGTNLPSQIPVEHSFHQGTTSITDNRIVTQPTISNAPVETTHANLGTTLQDSSQSLDISLDTTSESNEPMDTETSSTSYISDCSISSNTSNSLNSSSNHLLSAAIPRQSSRELYISPRKSSPDNTHCNLSIHNHTIDLFTGDAINRHTPSSTCPPSPMSISYSPPSSPSQSTFIVNTSLDTSCELLEDGRCEEPLKLDSGLEAVSRLSFARPFPDFFTKPWANGKCDKKVFETRGQWCARMARAKCEREIDACLPKPTAPPKLELPFKIQLDQPVSFSRRADLLPYISVASQARQHLLSLLPPEHSSTSPRLPYDRPTLEKEVILTAAQCRLARIDWSKPTGPLVPRRVEFVPNTATRGFQSKFIHIPERISDWTIWNQPYLPKTPLELFKSTLPECDVAEEVIGTGESRRSQEDGDDNEFETRVGRAKNKLSWSEVIEIMGIVMERISNNEKIVINSPAKILPESVRIRSEDHNQITHDESEVASKDDSKTTSSPRSLHPVYSLHSKLFVMADTASERILRKKQLYRDCVDNWPVALLNQVPETRMVTRFERVKRKPRKSSRRLLSTNSLKWGRGSGWCRAQNGLKSKNLRSFSLKSNIKMNLDEKNRAVRDDVGESSGVQGRECVSNENCRKRSTSQLISSERTKRSRIEEEVKPLGEIVNKKCIGESRKRRTEDKVKRDKKQLKIRKSKKIEEIDKGKDLEVTESRSRKDIERLSRKHENISEDAQSEERIRKDSNERSIIDSIRIGKVTSSKTEEGEEEEEDDDEREEEKERIAEEIVTSISDKMVISIESNLECLKNKSKDLENHESRQDAIIENKIREDLSITKLESKHENDKRERRRKRQASNSLESDFEGEIRIKDRKTDENIKSHSICEIEEECEKVETDEDAEIIEGINIVSDKSKKVLKSRSSGVKVKIKDIRKSSNSRSEIHCEEDGLNVEMQRNLKVKSRRDKQRQFERMAKRQQQIRRVRSVSRNVRIKDNIKTLKEKQTNIIIDRHSVNSTEKRNYITEKNNFHTRNSEKYSKRYNISQHRIDTSSFNAPDLSSTTQHCNPDIVPRQLLPSRIIDTKWPTARLVLLRRRVSRKAASKRESRHLPTIQSKLTHLPVVVTIKSQKTLDECIQSQDIRDEVPIGYHVKV